MIVQGTDLSSVVIKTGFSSAAGGMGCCMDHSGMRLRRLMGDHHHNMEPDIESEEQMAAECLADYAPMAPMGAYGPGIETYAVLEELGYYTVIGQANFNNTHYVTFNYGFNVVEATDDGANASSTASVSPLVSIVSLLAAFISYAAPPSLNALFYPSQIRFVLLFRA